MRQDRLPGLTEKRAPRKSREQIEQEVRNRRVSTEGVERMQGWDDFSITGSGMHVPGLTTVNEMARRREQRERRALPRGDGAA